MNINFGIGDLLLFFFEKKMKIKLPISQKTRWKWSTKSEIRYWNRWLKAKGFNRAGENDYRERVSNELKLQNEIENLLPKTKEVSILDVGAGPLTTLGKFSKRFKVNIIAIDPLADEYNKLLNKYKIDPVVRTIKLDVMKLRDKFQSNSFDLIFARNCIDHTYSPEKAILTMLEVVKKNHYILLKHKPNEAINQNWEGLHQWNFSIKNDDLIISSKNEFINFSQKFNNKFEVKCSYDKNENYINCVIKKL